MNEIDVELLIRLVEARPVLWDKELAEYHDRIKTKIAWNEICEELNPAFKNSDDKKQKKIRKSYLSYSL